MFSFQKSSGWQTACTPLWKEQRPNIGLCRAKVGSWALQVRDPKSYLQDLITAEQFLIPESCSVYFPTPLCHRCWLCQNTYDVLSLIIISTDYHFSPQYSHLVLDSCNHHQDWKQHMLYGFCLLICIWFSACLTILRQLVELSHLSDLWPFIRVGWNVQRTQGYLGCLVLFQETRQKCSHFSLRSPLQLFFLPTPWFILRRHLRTPKGVVTAV